MYITKIDKKGNILPDSIVLQSSIYGTYEPTAYELQSAGYHHLYNYIEGVYQDFIREDRLGFISFRAEFRDILSEEAILGKLPLVNYFDEVANNIEAGSHLLIYADADILTYLLHLREHEQHNTQPGDVMKLNLSLISTNNYKISHDGEPYILQKGKLASLYHDILRIVIF